MAKATTSLQLGQVEHFDNSTSDWTSYEERVHAYLRANNVPEERKVDAFISILGPQTYSLLKSLAAPDKPSSKSLESLCELLRKHLAPERSVIESERSFIAEGRRNMKLYRSTWRSYGHWHKHASLVHFLTSRFETDLCAVYSESTFKGTCFRKTRI